MDFPSLNIQNGSILTAEPLAEPRPVNDAETEKLFHVRPLSGGIGEYGIGPVRMFRERDGNARKIASAASGSAFPFMSPRLATENADGGIFTVRFLPSGDCPFRVCASVDGAQGIPSVAARPLILILTSHGTAADLGRGYNFVGTKDAVRNGVQRPGRHRHAKHNQT